MRASELQQMVVDAAAEVLETMFFTALVDDAVPQLANVPWLSARLSFCGKTSGSFGVRVPQNTGRNMAANFLGLNGEALSDSAIGEVVCELSNMLCGSVLSRMEKGAQLKLSHPELDEANNGSQPDGCTVSRLLRLEDGVLAVWLKLEQT